MPFQTVWMHFVTHLAFDAMNFEPAFDVLPMHLNSAGGA